MKKLNIKKRFQNASVINSHSGLIDFLQKFLMFELKQANYDNSVRLTKESIISRIWFERQLSIFIFLGKVYFSINYIYAFRLE